MAPEPFCTLRPNTRNGPALVLLSGVLFSGGGILYRSTSLNREKPVAAEWRYLSYRFIALTSAALLWIGISSACFSRSWPPLRSVSGSRWRRSAVAGLLMSMCNVCFIVALQRIDVATTLLLQSLAPFSAAILSWLVHRERVDAHTLCCIVLAVGGVVIMGSGWRADDALGLVAAGAIALMLGAYSVVLRGTGEAAPEPRLQLLLGATFGLYAAAAVGSNPGPSDASVNTRMPSSLPAART